MTRLAAILARRAGVKLLATVHDALVYEAPESEVETTTEAVQHAMRIASECTLRGFPVRTEVELYRYPERFSAGDQSAVWERLYHGALALESSTISHPPPRESLGAPP